MSTTDDYAAILIGEGDQPLGTVSLLVFTTRTTVIGRLHLEPAASQAPETALIKQLAEATDDLALAAMAQIENQLADLGLALRFPALSLKLILRQDFWGLVVTEECTQIAFDLAAPLP